MLYYSAETTGFYDDDIHASMPADVVPVTAETHSQLMTAQSQGQMIVAGPDGTPIAVDRPPPTPEQAMADLRAQRDRLLLESDFSQFPDAPLTDEQRAAWRAYRQALRDLPETASDPLAMEWPAAPSN